MWVAEVMLQQTRIATVVPAYERFLARFPDLASLAAAPEEEVLAAWSGLGYYSRPRALHRAAAELHAQGQTFPNDLTTALRLPGVGPYTAAAVLSIAYGAPHATIDGNVVRVLSRLFRLEVRSPSHRSVVAAAAALLDPQAPGDWNQALMELGEVICLPGTPRCGECPWEDLCEARQEGETDRFPPRAPRRTRETRHFDLFVEHDGEGRVLLERGIFPFLPHLWMPPLREIATEPSLPPVGCEVRGTLKHAIVHRDFVVRVLEQRRTPSALARRATPRPRQGERALFDREERHRIGRSSLLLRSLRRCGIDP